MKERIYIATFAKNACPVARDYGYGLELNDLCISVNLDPLNRERVLARMKREIAACYGEEWFQQPESERRKVIMHGPFTELTPSAIDPRAIALMNERYDQTLAFCRELGIRDFVLHDGHIPLLYHKEWHHKRSVQFWQAFAERLPAGMTCYIENVFDDEPELLTGILDETDRDCYRICLDVGHAHCMTGKDWQVTDWIRHMGRRIGHFHIHNNDGSADQHNDVMDGSLDMEAVLRTAAAYCDADVTFTVESREAEPSARWLLAGERE